MISRKNMIQRQVRKMANKTVTEIVEKAKSGDKTAFDLLYREYSEKLLPAKNNRLQVNAC